MTIQSMLFWINNNLSPYVNSVRTLLKENLKCVLICDGLKAHLHVIIFEELSKIGIIKVISLPSHSSHISQMLDISVFNSLKKKYGSTPKNLYYTSEFTRKIMKIKSTYQSTVFDELIRSSWERAGFHLILDQVDASSYEFSDKFKEFLRAEAH